jgi:mono/diheme cytochrome c family protein
MRALAKGDALTMTRSGTKAALVAGVALTVAMTSVLAQGKGDPKAGEVLYRKECLKCHGTTGVGDGPQGQKLKEKPSNWTADGGGLKGMDEQAIWRSIAEGGRAVGKSKGMPAYPKLSDADVWNLVAYVKSLVK